jgi:RND family efflux transporter MFP subunit
VLEAREQAERLVEAAEVQLRYFDVSDEQIDQLRKTRELSKTLTINSPARGIVTEKMALGGMYVKPGMRLLTIADLSRVWVFVDVYEYQLPWVRVGQPAAMTLPYTPGREFTGRVVYIYPYLEKQTRVAKVRLEFENPTLELKPEMYANVVLEADLGRDALLIPREAYIDSGTRQVAFVALGDGKYQPRDVRVGVEAEDGMVEVRYGLDEGERIVTSGQFMLDAESKLKEAVAKMLEGQQRHEGTEARRHEGHAAAGGVPPDAAYACPMDTHPGETDPAKQGAFFSAEPGRCDWCGMTLKPLEELDWAVARRAAGESETAYTCPEHPHVFSKQPGECPRCGRALEPFKVMYTCPDREHADVISTVAGDCPKDGKRLTPYRGIWLSPEMADDNAPPSPEVAQRAAYRCPLHRLAHSDRPGKCTICAADLQPTSPIALADEATLPTTPPGAQYVCPMHPEQVSADERGTCLICGMRLVAADAVPRPTSAPAAIAAQMNYLMEHYLELQKRYASDRTSDAALHALGLVGAAGAILTQLDDPAVDLPDEFGDAVRKLRAGALKTTGKDLEADRVTFIEIGAAMRTLVKHVRPDRQQYPDIYIYHCPMTKGDWLQASDEMANPFYGFEMLKCGELRETR